MNFVMVFDRTPLCLGGMRGLCSSSVLGAVVRGRAVPGRWTTEFVSNEVMHDDGRHVLHQFVSRGGA
jgi:hypothetical protein